VKVITNVKDSVNDRQKQMNSVSPGPIKTPVNDAGKKLVIQPEIHKHPDVVSQETHNASLGTETKKVYYSVQIGALNQPIDPSPDNFKGEKSVFRVKVNPYFKFYSGKFNTPEEASEEKSRLSQKFPDAFIAVFENDVPRFLRSK
jgi:hypothetical protein